MMPIHPLRQLRYERERDREIIDATVADLEELGPYAYTGFSYPWRAEFYAIQGNGKKAYDTLKLFWSNYCLPNGFHCNGDYRNELGLQFTYRPFTLEANMCAIDALQEMMLYDGEGRTVIAPALPDSWKDYSFKLRSINGFVITATVRNGALTEALIEAYKDVDAVLCLGDTVIAALKLKKDQIYKI
jgi:alpha-L-fucosidase 2